MKRALDAPGGDSPFPAGLAAAHIFSCACAPRNCASKRRSAGAVVRLHALVGCRIASAPYLALFAWFGGAHGVPKLVWEGRLRLWWDYSRAVCGSRPADGEFAESRQPYWMRPWKLT